MNILNLIGRDKLLFAEDLLDQDKILHEMVAKSRFLVLGGAGSIGQAVVKEISLFGCSNLSKKKNA